MYTISEFTSGTFGSCCEEKATVKEPTLEIRSPWNHASPACACTCVPIVVGFSGNSLAAAGPSSCRREAVMIDEKSDVARLIARWCIGPSKTVNGSEKRASKPGAVNLKRYVPTGPRMMPEKSASPSWTTCSIGPDSTSPRRGIWKGRSRGGVSGCKLHSSSTSVVHRKHGCPVPTPSR
eukprot:3306177-Rhodomonas_salina.2